MTRVALPFAIFFGMAIIGHVGVLYAVPGTIMSAAMTRMEARGLPLHAFAQSPRTTPATQTVVRPSPDLAYSICRFDFTVSDRPLDISAGAWRDYGSISLFDARTNNFATIAVPAANGTGPATRFVLHPPSGARPEKQALGSGHIQAPTKRGLILIRRLAPTAEAHKAVQDVAQTDRCEPIEDHT